MADSFAAVDDVLLILLGDDIPVQIEAGHMLLESRARRLRVLLLYCIKDRPVIGYDRKIFDGVKAQASDTVEMDAHEADHVIALHGVTDAVDRSVEFVIESEDLIYILGKIEFLKRQVIFQFPKIIAAIAR